MADDQYNQARNSNSEGLTHTSANKAKPVLGISECLMGKEVRYNGGHKLSRFCTQVLSKYFEFRPICPEVEIGLSIPRPTIRLAEKNNQLRVIASDNPDVDYSEDLLGLARSVAPSMENLSGFIFMQKSPSCGLKSTKVYGEKGQPIYMSDGAFSGELQKLLPLMPVTESGRLNDNGLKENFIASVYAYHEWQTEVLPNLSSSVLTRFHYRHKLMLSAHNEQVAIKLGQLLSNLKGADLNQVADTYIELFMAALKEPVTRKRHASILLKMQRFLKTKLDHSEKQELSGVIEHYKKGIVPLIVPMTLVKFFMKKYQEHEALSLLDAYPMELGLQNGI
ncbi:MAG: YbgA family protein [Oleiphilus sp.]